MLLPPDACELALDPNTAHRNVLLSDDRRRVTLSLGKQPYPDHPDRFECWLQVLCSAGLTGRCYWEVELEGRVYVAVTHEGIRRGGEGTDVCLGTNDHSWALICHGDGSYSVRHNDRATRIRSPSSFTCGLCAPSKV